MAFDSPIESPPKSFEVIQEDETDPAKIAEAATDFMFEMAKEESIKLIEEDRDLSSMTDQQKKIFVKLMCDRVVEKYMQKFKRELHRKVKSEKVSESDFELCKCTSEKEYFFFLGENDAIKTVTFSYVFEPCKCVECNIDTEKKESEKTNEELLTEFLYKESQRNIRKARLILSAAEQSFEEIKKIAKRKK